MPGERSVETEDELRQRITRTVTDAELSALEGWEALEVLSNRTDVDGIEVFEDLIRIDGADFNGPMNVCVVLNYLKDGDKGFAVSEGFPGKFSGHMVENGSVVIDRISVDTKSFYDWGPDAGSASGLRYDPGMASPPPLVGARPKTVDETEG